MNLFRSEEHARNWPGFTEESASTIRPLAEWAGLFSNRYFKERSRPDFISWAQSEEGKKAFGDLRERTRF